jgi:hypothetical protein
MFKLISSKKTLVLEMNVKKNMFCVIFIFICSLIFSINDPVLVKTYNLEDFDIFQPSKMIVFENAIFILDRSNFEIIKLFNGKRIVSFGKRGEGPKEYLYPVGYNLGNNSISVQDIGGKIIKFNLSGEWVETIKREKSDIFNNDILLLILNKNRYIGRRMKFGLKSDSNITYYYRNKDLVKTLLRMDLSLDKIKFGRGNFLSLLNSLFTIGHSYCFYTKNKNQFKINAFNIKNEKRELWIEDQNYQLIAYSKEELLKSQNEKREILKKAPGLLKETLKKQKLPKLKPAIKDLVADENDYLYIITNELKSESNLTQIYDPNAKYLKSLWIPKYKIIQISKTKIYLIVEEDDTFKLKIYKI